MFTDGRERRERGGRDAWSGGKRVGMERRKMGEDGMDVCSVGRIVRRFEEEENGKGGRDA